MTVWSWIVGYNVSGTLWGLIAALIILFMSIYGCVRYASRAADAKAQSMVALYDEQCDPEAFLTAAAQVTPQITPPVLEPGAWFLALLGQASLDTGDRDTAKTDLDILANSVLAAKTGDIRAGILTNAIPLALKLQGPEQTMALIDEALQALSASTSPHALLQKTYLSAQRDLCAAMLRHDNATLIERYRRIREDARAVERLRVEYAWHEARICYEEGRRDEELECLRFIVDHGGKLAFVPTARNRLAELGG